jgi:hypothetical protein
MHVYMYVRRGVWPHPGFFTHACMKKDDQILRGALLGTNKLCMEQCKICMDKYLCMEPFLLRYTYSCDT